MSTSSRRRRTNRPGSRRPARNITASAYVPVEVDFTREYKYIRRDLIRILVWGGGLIALIVILHFAKVF